MTKPLKGRVSQQMKQVEQQNKQKARLRKQLLGDLKISTSIGPLGLLLKLSPDEMIERAFEERHVKGSTKLLRFVESEASNKGTSIVSHLRTSVMGVEGEIDVEIARLVAYSCLARNLSKSEVECHELLQKARVVGKSLSTLRRGVK
jgi:hypothetical protein